MQPILSAVSHLADEIARTRSHLSALESALDGMKPLLSRMDPQEVQKALGYIASNGARRLNASDVEIVEVAAAAGTVEVPVLPTAPDEGSARSAIVRKYSKAPRKNRKAGSVTRKAAVRNAAHAATIPATGTAFWLACMGKKKHTVNEIVDRALVRLELGPQARKTLYNRLNAWLYPKVKSGELFSPGEKAGIKLYQVAG